MIIVSAEMQRLRSQSCLVAHGQKPSSVAGVRLRPERIKQSFRARLYLHVTRIADPLRVPFQRPVSAFIAVELDDVRGSLQCRRSFSMCITILILADFRFSRMLSIDL